MQTRALRGFLIDFALALTQGALHFSQLNVARLAFGLRFIELRLQLFNLRGQRIAASRTFLELLLQRSYFLFVIRDTASAAHRGVFGLLATGPNRTSLFGKQHIGRLKTLDHHMEAPALRGEVAHIQAFFLKRKLQRFESFLGFLGFDFLHIDACGGFKEAPNKLLAGGPMMGNAQFSLDAPVVKGTNAFLAFAGNEDKRVKDPQCIRCGKCINACPMHLLPVYMNVYGKQEDLDNAVECGMLDCIECGSCAYVCPARIPLVAQFRLTKGKIQAKRAAERAKAEAEKKKAEAEAAAKAEAEKPAENK